MFSLVPHPIKGKGRQPGSKGENQLAAKCCTSTVTRGGMHSENIAQSPRETPRVGPRGPSKGLPRAQATPDRAPWLMSQMQLLTLTTTGRFVVVRTHTLCFTNVATRLFQIRSGKKPDDVGVMQACLDGWGRNTHTLICRRRGKIIAYSSIVEFSEKGSISRGFLLLIFRLFITASFEG